MRSIRPFSSSKGSGRASQNRSRKKSIATAEDLLYHLPFRYEDRANPRTLHELVAGETASVIGEVRGSVLLRTRAMPIFEMTLGQGTGTLKCIWFRGTYLKDRFQPGQTVAVFGKVEASRSSRGFKMIQPQFEILPEATEEFTSLEMGRITPIYETPGRHQARPALAARAALHAARRVARPHSGDVARRSARTARHAVPGYVAAAGAFSGCRRSIELSLQAARTPAHRRLIFEELFFLELGLEMKRREARERPASPSRPTSRCATRMREVLPFHPTAAQKRALGEIVEDMSSRSPMRRLLQGDVGSGKTIVALQAMLIAIENGYQAALMAPTEILATQHYLGARKLLERATRDYRVMLLTGSLDVRSQARGTRTHRARRSANWSSAPMP